MHADLGDAVKSLWAHYGRNLGQDGRQSWVALLKKYDGPILRRIFTEWAQTQTSVPTTAAILARYHSMSQSKPEALNRQEQSADEARRSQHSAVLSMLWLHYFQGWKLDDFGGHILGQLFGKNPKDALEAAKEIYDQDTVCRWMEDQNRLKPSTPAPIASPIRQGLRQPEANATRNGWQELQDIG
jgi:hypothetical protein